MLLIIGISLKLTPRATIAFAKFFKFMLNFPKFVLLLLNKVIQRLPIQTKLLCHLIRHSLSWFQILIYVNSSSFRRPPCLWVLSCETKVFPQLSALPPNLFVLKALSHSILCLSSYLSNLNGLRARIININIKQRLLFIQLALIIEFQA